jgi:hypothetical protein
MRGRLAVLIAAALLTLLPVNSPGVSEAAKRCTVADLNGTYVFAATGFGTPPGGSSPTAPRAIIEVISFNGDGTVDTPKVTLSVNGTVINESPGSSGTDTIDTSTANGVFTGTLNFNGGAPNFDIYFGPSGDSDISLIQTDKGNVFRGTATRRAH